MTAVATKQLIMLNVGIVICTIIAIIFFSIRAVRKQRGTFDTIKKQKKIKRYWQYYNNVFTRGKFRAIVQRYETLNCYSMDDVKVMSVDLFQRALTVCFMIPILTLIAMRDIPTMLLSMFISYVYYDMTIDRVMDKSYVQIIKDLSVTIQSIQENYLQTENIATAVLNAEKSPLLNNSMSMVYDVLEDVDGENILEDFCRSSPVRQIKTLAVACKIMHTSGDERAENGGSAFINCLTTIQQEVDAEERRLIATSIAFKSLAVLTLVGLFVTPICNWFLLSQIPGTAILLKGMYGSITSALLIVLTIICYYVLSTYNRPHVVNQSDVVPWFDDIVRMRKVTQFSKEIQPKKYKNRAKMERILKDSLSVKDLDYIYIAKFVAAVFGFITTLVFLIIFVMIAKDQLYHNYNSLSAVPGPAMEARVYDRVVAMDNEYLKAKKPLPKEELRAFVRAHIGGMVKDFEVDTNTDRLEKKYTKYHSLKVKWWFPLVAYLVAVIMWFSQEMLLKLRTKLVEYEAGEDVMQLQTLMIVLSHTKMDVDDALFWMERQSSVHKAIIRYAYHEYHSDPLGSLERLKDASSHIDFKRLIAKLQTAVYVLSIQDAFKAMALNKAHSLQKREMYMMETIESRKNNAKLIAMAPAGFMLVFRFVGVILAVGVSDLLKTFQDVNNLDTGG